MPIRDNTEALALLKTIDAKNLRTDIDRWLSTQLEGRNQNNLSNNEMQKIFIAADPLVQDKYNIDIWDAMMLLNVAQQERSAEERPQLDGFDDWRAIYDAVHGIAERLQISPHLQDDYGGGNEFHVWCSTTDFSPLASAIRNAKLRTTSAFKVVVIELSNDNPTGKQHAISTTWE
jgi:hypothetical protein